jgi:N6-L-threonylcarbamoyladenine synthase
MSDTTLLAIETSCDETAVAVVKKIKEKVTVLSQTVASQVDIHAITGGVVPEVAAREHVASLPSLLQHTLAESKITSEKLDAIAVTVGPGLMPALVIGVTAAQTLAYSWNKPIVPIHHLEGHIASALYSAEENPKPKTQNPNNFTIPDSKQVFPALALIVSGGHTMLVQLNDHLHYKLLGSTRDDAAGEAFDKVARLLELPYPGGPAISMAARDGNAQAFSFTRPMLRSGDLDFSFSGLKTEVLYQVRELRQEQPTSAFINDVAASFQAAVVDSLIAKTSQAMDKMSPRCLLLAGGVAANTQLRHAFSSLGDRNNIPVKVAPLSLCSDNAVMIGLAAVSAYDAKRLASWSDIDAAARPQLSDFTGSNFTA